MGWTSKHKARLQVPRGVYVHATMHAAASCIKLTRTRAVSMRCTLCSNHGLPCWVVHCRRLVHRRLPCLLHAKLGSPVSSVLSNCSAAGFVPSSLTSLLQSQQLGSPSAKVPGSSTRVAEGRPSPSGTAAQATRLLLPTPRRGATTRGAAVLQAEAGMGSAGPREQRSTGAARIFQAMCAMEEARLLQAIEAGTWVEVASADRSTPFTQAVWGCLKLAHPRKPQQTCKH